MMQTVRIHLAIGNRQPPMRPAFTLVEMLTVIGIIVLLVSILLPVVSAVRTKGHQADTQAMLARIAAGIESYHSDLKAYPGPLHNGQIYNGGIDPQLGNFTDPDSKQITQSENLVLGLLGGLVMVSDKPTYDANAIGNGPVSLNSRAPKKYRAYMDKVSLSAGEYSDSGIDADKVKDSKIPEFLDKYPDPMPILYMRAKAGSTGIVSNKKLIGEQEQYDLKQIEAYTTVGIGVGREAPSDEDFRPGPVPTTTADKIKHGLQTVDKGKSITNPGVPAGTTYQYPYDLYAFMRHPSMSSSPRQKDGYILISAGSDRIYGTKDDAVYPASR